LWSYSTWWALRATDILTQYMGETLCWKITMYMDHAWFLWHAYQLNLESGTDCAVRWLHQNKFMVRPR